MVRYPFQIYIWATDTSYQDKFRLQEALTKLNEDYQQIEDWGLEYTLDFTLEPKWVPYKDDLTINLEQLADKAREVKRLYGEQYHSILLLVKDWKAKTYGGINWNRFFSGMSGQYVRWYSNVKDLYEVIAEELAHSLDEQIERELGIDIEKELGVDGDVDDIFVHGLKYTDYKRAIRKPNWSYMSYYKLIEPLIMEAMKKRYERWQAELKQKVSLLTTIVSLLEKTIRLYREIKVVKKPPKVVDNRSSK